MPTRNIRPEERKRVYETKCFLLNHLHQHLPITLLARYSAMSKEKFKEAFLALSGFTIGRYIHQTKMLLGYFLLTHTDKPIKEISFLTGYQYTKNFMTAYKKYFGKTAGAVRA